MNRPVTFHDQSRENAVSQRRIIAALFGVIVMIVILVVRMYFLQIQDYSKYHTISDSNRIQVEPIAPTRGLILDRNGNILANNSPTFAVSVTRELTPDLDATIEKLRSIITIPESDLQRFKKRMQQRRRPMTAVAIRYNLNEEEIALLSVRAYELPGVTIEANLVRHYPQPELFSHTIGYVGRINEKELRKVDANNYGATEYIGKTGIERFYEDALHGTVGFQKVETDARGKVTRVLERIDPVAGKNLHLYLDLPTQEAAAQAMADKRGAVVAIDPDTGGIIAFLSAPGFDSNLFVTGIDHRAYKAMQADRWRPLFNRALQGQYPPGSTVKPMVGLAGLDAGFVDWKYTIFDPGFYKLDGDGRLYRDWKKWGHGYANLDTAITQSCDTYFYELAHRMGVDRLHTYLDKFNFGRLTEVDMSGENTGVLPSSEWKRKARKERWYPGETLSVGIGQGYMLATPLQLATATAIMANRGKQIHPRMVEWMSAKEQKDEHIDAPVAGHIDLRNQAEWNNVIAAMRNVVHSDRGTAWNSIGKTMNRYDIAGKTGTAQVIGMRQGEAYHAERLQEWQRDHAWFMGFAPVDHPRIAIAALVENGGHGGSTAAPVVKAVMDAYFTSMARRGEGGPFDTAPREAAPP